MRVGQCQETSFGVTIETTGLTRPKRRRLRTNECSRLRGSRAELEQCSGKNRRAAAIM